MMERGANAFPLWLGYCAFVVYGSLVPLEFRPLPIDEAWRLFQRTPILEIGAEHRADWISNIVLFVPVGFLSAYAMLQSWPRLPRSPLLALAAAFSFALAGGIEFAQIFFPPRTVALNDLFAEAVGSVFGIAVAARYSSWFTAARRPGPLAAQPIDHRWLVLYLVAYLAFSLFPFDFVLSAAELDHKLASSSLGWIIAASSQGMLLDLPKLLVEVVVTLPIGWWFASRSPQLPDRRTAAWFGALLGGGIELAQLFMVSGVSQGLSVVTRIAGVVLGVLLWEQSGRWSLASLSGVLRRYAPWLGAAYLLALLQVNHWFSTRWQLAIAAQKLHDLRFLPFYYHYYTTEMAALASLLTVTLLYAPIAVGGWALRWSRTATVGLACAAAGAVELGKLFIQLGHPDPTNLVIAGAAAWALHRMLGALEQSASRRAVQPVLVAHETRPPIGAGTASMGLAPNLPARLLCLAAMGLGIWGVTRFPVVPALLATLLATAAVAVWWRPSWLFLIVAAALPVLDLAQWSGRLLVDEFDLLLLVTIAVAWMRAPTQPRSAHNRDPMLHGITAALALALVIGVAQSVLPWRTIDSLPFEALQGPLNALRIVKGAVWALLLARLWRRFDAAGHDPWRALAVGTVVGLALTVALILWERATFAQLFDVGVDYRVTGPFSAMHTGGAYIECFLVVAASFLLVLIIKSRHWLSQLAGSLLLAASTYALMVTFSRAAMPALAVATTIVLVARMLGRGPRRAWPLALAALMLLVAVPVVRGPFAQTRLGTTESDLSLRVRHWMESASLHPGGISTALFGAGLGRYPELHYWRHASEDRSAIFHLLREPRGPMLRLGSGDPIYVEQIVTIAPRSDYMLHLDVRSGSPNAEIEISLCEKWLLASFDCVRAVATSSAVPNEWKTLALPFNSSALGARPWYATGPVKLALRNPPQALAFDVANLRLQDASGRMLLDNGDFSSGMDHWFFTADSHLPWHTKSLPIGIWFDLGWLGAAAFGALFGLASLRAARAARGGNLQAAAVLAALAGFAVIGIFDTLIDDPRFLLILLGLCGLGAAYCRRTQSPVTSAASAPPRF